MMFRRAGAMRCNSIFLHHRGTSEEINRGGGRRGNFSFGFLVSYDCSFWSAARTELLASFPTTSAANVLLLTV